jgi:hypothetical protein
MARIRLGSRVFVVGLLGVLLGTYAPVTATAGPECSYGDAMAVFQALPPLFYHQPRDALLPACQYRAFFDGEHVTFYEDDWFVGGSVFFWEYQQLGMSREEGIAELEKLTARLWLSEIGPGGEVGSPVEQPLMETGYKSLDTLDFGLTVYRHDGVILHLPPVDYLSTWEVSWEGEVIEHYEMTIHVLPTG